MILPISLFIIIKTNCEIDFFKKIWKQEYQTHPQLGLNNIRIKWMKKYS